MIVDAHHHFWTKAQYAAIYEAYGSPTILQPLLRDYSPEDMQPLLTEMGIDRTVLMQIESTFAHNHELLGIAEVHDYIGAVIGWVDLEAADLDEQLDRLCTHEKFRGIRDPLEFKSATDWVLQPAVQRGLRSLSEHQLIFELLMGHDHWEVLPKLAKAIPDLTLVVNHFGKPDTDRFEAWLQMLNEIAPLSQIMVKLSGIMVLFSQSDWNSWSVEQIQPYIDQLLEIIGPQRLMIATDWPVSTLIGSYEKVFNAIKTSINSLSEHEQAQILGENACRSYAIQ